MQMVRRNRISLILYTTNAIVLLLLLLKIILLNSYPLRSDILQPTYLWSVLGLGLVLILSQFIFVFYMTRYYF